MDFEAALSKESPIGEQARAATFFRSLGVDGEKHLALLFAAMNRVDLTRRELDKHEIVLVGLGAISIASTLNKVGFNPTSSVHSEMAQWILRNTSSPNIEVSAYCIIPRPQAPHAAVDIAGAGIRPLAQASPISVDVDTG